MDLQDLTVGDGLRHAFAVVGGLRLHVAHAGTERSNTPVLLLHGMTDSYLTWRVVAPHFADDRKVWMPDLPGCGLSERPQASYALQWHARVIADWLRMQGITQVDVVGHSFGGGVAQMLLLECPERIRRIVLVASGGLGREVGFWLRLATLAPTVVEYLGQPFMSFGTRRSLSGTSDPEIQSDVTALSRMNAQPGTARAFARTASDVIDWRGQRRLFSQRADEVVAFPPMAVLWGQQDRVIPHSHGRRFAQSMRGVVFESFPDSGHYLHRERPVAFAEKVRAFLDSPSAERVCPVPAPPAAPSMAGRLRAARDRADPDLVGTASWSLMPPEPR